MRRSVFVILMVVFVISMFSACGGVSPNDESEKITLNIYAAASMTETLEEIEVMYENDFPDIDLVFTLDSSGTLQTQIENGGICDVFISAAQKQMDALDVTKDAEKNPEGQDFVLQGTRVDLLENKVALTVPEGNPKGLDSFDALKAGLSDGSIFMAMGNGDVPVGQYTQKILEYFGLDEDSLAAEGLITYGTNVKEVTTQVSEATVDCGIIYATDAFSAGLTIVDTATAEMCGRVIYPAAVMNTTEHEEEARAFLDYLTEKEAGAVFESVGFTPLY